MSLHYETFKSNLRQSRAPQTDALQNNDHQRPLRSEETIAENDQNCLFALGKG